MLASAYLFIPFGQGFNPSPLLFTLNNDGSLYLPASSSGSTCSGTSCVSCDPDHESCGGCGSDADCGPPPPSQCDETWGTCGDCFYGAGQLGQWHLHAGECGSQFGECHPCGGGGPICNEFWEPCGSCGDSRYQWHGGLPDADGSGDCDVECVKTDYCTYLTCSGGSCGEQGAGNGRPDECSSDAQCTPPPGGFNLSLSGAVACNSVPLSWTASGGADAYRILRGAPRVDISPYQPYTALNYIDYLVSQNTSYLYQIEAYNGGGTNRSNTINATTPYCPPTLNFSGNPTSIFEGQSTTLTWSTSYVTSCAASGAWSGSKAVNGSEVVVPLPPPSITYTLTCAGPGGAVNQSVIVTITPLALPDWREIIPR